MKDPEGSGPSQSRDPLARFLHELSGPLSAVALQLESATRAVSRGKDPSRALAMAREELEKAFRLFERGRAFLLNDRGEPPRASRP